MKMDLSTLTTAYARGELAVLSVERKTASNGPYALLTLTDGDRDIVGKRWKFDGTLPAVGKVLEIVAEVDEYRGRKQLNIKGWKAGTTGSEEFEKTGPIDVAYGYEQLLAHIELIDNDSYKDPTLRLFQQYKAEMLRAPAAITVHHNYIGGWIQHTLEVVEAAVASAEVMRKTGQMDIDMNLLRAGALLHDIGKLYTYRMNGAAIEMTNEGQFLEHIVLGSHMVLNQADAVSMGETERLKLTHCIVGHHLNLEWGSPVKPVMSEVYLIHYADQVSAKCTMISEARKGCETEWTPKNYFLGTRLYNGDRK